MNAEHYRVLQAIYELEEQRLKRNEFDFWLTPAEIAQQASERDEAWVRLRLQELWSSRKLLQLCRDVSDPMELRDVTLDELDRHAPGEERLKLEDNDVRGDAGSPFQQVAIFSPTADVRYRSRVAETARMLSYNYQRFNMAPSTGLLRYERRPQLRPLYTWPIEKLAADWSAMARSGRLQLITDAGISDLSLGSDVDTTHLAQAIEGVLLALADQLRRPDRPATLAEFQVRSIAATLCGLYCPKFRDRCDAHVVTAGVGSGKSFAFQIGALIHVAHRAITGKRGIQVLLLYPRVVLAANQFQDLDELVQATGKRIGISLSKPVLDAGGQLAGQMGTQDDDQQSGKLYRAVQMAYQGDYQILISNLDTLSNRLVHPEAVAALTQGLDLIVMDEVHILRGIYGAHARMLLARIELLRALWKLRRQHPNEHFEQLLDRCDKGEVRSSYFIAASATISGPARHTARILSRSPERVLHIDRGTTAETGWVHHLFMRQRPETSSATAAINAVSALIHNRRDGTFREYYQLGEGGTPIALSDLDNPVQPSEKIRPRNPRQVHKVLGFCDSLDAVGRWGDQVADNEQTKFVSMGASPNPAQGEPPYFVRFQEPLWRLVHHSSFSADPTRWQQSLWQHYGGLCRDCKKGIKKHVPRIPVGLTPAQREAVERLWSVDPKKPEGSYLDSLGVKPDSFAAEWFRPLVDASTKTTIGNLDECAFMQCGTCWWWSQDHLGSNHPTPAKHSDPVNGYLQPIKMPEQRYHAVNAIRLRTFTSNSEFDAMKLDSIDDLFQDKASRIFRNQRLQELRQTRENSSFVIGSPKIEVGIDMDRVTDGITFRAMRDPASLQQKSGRVGREMMADSMVLHVVTDNLREQFYFRNPRIALDPQYLQAIPLHERNAIVARNHYFMSIVDFLCLQGEGPNTDRVANDGHRLNLINDFLHRPNNWSAWEAKVRAVNAFLFAGHPRQAKNMANAKRFLRMLGANEEEAARNGVPLPIPAASPLTEQMGALDVFRHEMGEGLLLTPLNVHGVAPTLVQACCYPRIVPQPIPKLPTLPRHEAFFKQFFEKPDETVMSRSYLWQVLTMPLFRRGIPKLNLRGDQPYVWVPNLFEAVGNESVRVILQVPETGALIEKGFVNVGTAVALLPPGTFTYRYFDDRGPAKVPVNACGAKGLAPLMPRVAAVRLDVTDQEFYEPANCPAVSGDDLPENFVSTGGVLTVYRPRQIGLIPASSTPIPTLEGFIADDDDATLQSGGTIVRPLPAPPRCFPLRWYRLTANSPETIPCRFQANFAPPVGAAPLPRLPWPEVANLFSKVLFDASLGVTDFVWGLDRTFTTRLIEPAKLVYRDASDPTSTAVAVGHHYNAPGLEFQMDLRPEAPIGAFIEQILANSNAPVYQSLLWQVLHAFLSEHACYPRSSGTPPWTPLSKPSVFIVQNLRKLVVFHLLGKWHPRAVTNQRPTGSFDVTIADVAGCFQPSHPNFISQSRFDDICSMLAQVQNPVSIQGRTDRLREDYSNFLNACSQAALLNDALFRATAKRVLLNTLGLVLHTAALRQTGAEDADLSYFFKLREDSTGSIFLFDTDPSGNGTSDVIRENFYISAAERALVAKLQAMGHSPDPLPTKDFLTSFEESLQECPNSQSAHLAFHGLPATDEPFKDLQGAVEGERQTAGPLFDFVRSEMGLNSFDHLMPFQMCTEFLAHITSTTAGYGVYAHHPLVGSRRYPTFHSLESAMGFCTCGCIECVVSPEQNILGPQSAGISVNKLLLDALYRIVVCESGTSRSILAYPGPDVGRTVTWSQLAQLAAKTLSQPVPNAPTIQVVLPAAYAGEEESRQTIIPSALLGSWDRVFRTTLAAATTPQPLVRLRMNL